MADKYSQIAKSVIEKVGGKENIISATHCVTRLRLIVKDRSLIKEDELLRVDEVKGTFFNSGQYQVVFGSGTVNKVYNAVVQEGIDGLAKGEQPAAAEKNEKMTFKRAVRILGDVFVPIVPAIAATGLFLGLKGIITNNTILQAFGLSNAGIPPYFITLLTVLTDTVFSFLPALVCWSAFKVFGGSQLLGIVLGLMLVHPALPNAYQVVKPESGITPIMAFGFIPLVGYQGSIIPALIAGILGAKLEKKLRKVVPNVLDTMFTPFLVLLIMMVASLLVIGPVFHTVEQGVLKVVDVALHLPFGIGGFIISFAYPFIVVTGVHHIFTPLQAEILAANGFNPFNGIIVTQTLGIAFSVLAITIKTRKKYMKPIGISAVISAFLGITEPAMFGLSLRYNIKPMITGSLAAGIGGLLALNIGLQAKGMGIGGLLATVLYIYDFSQITKLLIVIATVAVLAFTITWFFGVPDEFMEEE